MKKDIYIAISLAIVCLTSCVNNIELSSLKVDDTQTITQIKDVVIKYLDLNKYKIYSIRWEENEKLSNNLLQITIEMIDNSNCCYVQHFVALKADIMPTAPRKVDADDQDIKFKQFKGIQLSALDPQLIKNQYVNAKTLIPMECVFKSVAYHEIREAPTNNNPIQSNINTQFRFNVVESNTIRTARRSTENHASYVLDFRASLPNGQVKLAKQY